MSLSTICKYLHNEVGFTREKMVITAKQRSEFLRFKYLTDMAVYVRSSIDYRATTYTGLETLISQDTPPNT